MAKKKQQKLRADFRKNRGERARQRDWTQQFGSERLDEDRVVSSERVSGKGELTRKRTVVGEQVEDEQAGFSVRREVDQSACLRGRVVNVHGLISRVQAEDGVVHRCATRRLLKTLSTDQRHVVATGDRVQFRPATGGTGLIERVEPRHGVLCRATRGRQQILVANVDQMLIVSSVAEPYLKPNLIDRLLVCAEQSRIEPVICLNKIDLVDPAELQPLVGVYSQMGYKVLLVSARSGMGIERLRRQLRDRETVLTGQSGVGKSSLLNAVSPGLELKVGIVSAETQKGKHTTTTAQLLPLPTGGWVVDTPGIRQFELWDIVPGEVAGFYRDLRPFINHCRFPNCTHTHEADCAVKNAVADDLLDSRRYESYCHLFGGEGNE